MLLSFVRKNWNEITETFTVCGMIRKEMKDPFFFGSQGYY